MTVTQPAAGADSTGNGSTGDGFTGTVADAYAHCEAVTREQARNFSYGIRLLPADKRAALSAVYALARRIDDIGDDPGPAEAKLAGLERVRTDLGRIGADRGDPVLVAVADAARRLPIPVEAFGELVDGVEADVRGTRYETIDALVGYCRCVAGSIGRLSLGVFGGPTDAGELALARDRADALGVALQLTNVLRDVREDLANGRIYLPAADLDRFGAELVATADGRVRGPLAPIVATVRFEAARARTWYVEGLRLLPMLDARSAASTAAMAGIYRRLLERISARPDHALQRRLSLPAPEKVSVAVTSLTGAALSSARSSRGRRR